MVPIVYAEVLKITALSLQQCANDEDYNIVHQKQQNDRISVNYPCWWSVNHGIHPFRQCTCPEFDFWCIKCLVTKTGFMVQKWCTTLICYCINDVFSHKIGNFSGFCSHNEAKHYCYWYFPTFINVKVQLSDLLKYTNICWCICVII
jgi:hypothetical protein